MDNLSQLKDDIATTKQNKLQQTLRPILSRHRQVSLSDSERLANHTDYSVETSDPSYEDATYMDHLLRLY